MIVKKITSGPATLTDQYYDHMKSLPPEKKLNSCEVNFKSHKYLRRNQKNLFMNNPQMAIPNYNGMYLLLENPIERGSEWFVVNCMNGKFETILPVTSDIMFDADSRVIVTKTFGHQDTLKSFQKSDFSIPKIYEWSNKHWVSIENPIQ